MNAEWQSIAVPDSHLDLIAGPYPVALSTLMPDGQPQSTVVWCNTDGRYVLLCRNAPATSFMPLAAIVKGCQESAKLATETQCSKGAQRTSKDERTSL